ncbi:hypothetical protein TGRH88_031540 [Toxoplasma gondii]|uniref:Uncharacterized protein n=1 Tax=Toxoplasma gondii TaxID=5811 RepID=A0A7J6K8M7_TOXGO|nr:hypothetical protein TGRH88_031540 [Toxoplasma gondii]
MSPAAGCPAAEPWSPFAACSLLVRGRARGANYCNGYLIPGCWGRILSFASRWPRARLEFLPTFFSGG